MQVIQCVSQNLPTLEFMILLWSIDGAFPQITISVGGQINTR